MAFVDTYAFEETVLSAPAVAHTNTQRVVRGYVELLPPGDLWPREPGTKLYELCDGLSMEGERVSEAVRTLLDSRDPRKAYDLLADYEDLLSLPETTDAATTIEARQLAAYEKLTTPGGISPDHLIEIAASLGYVIEVEHAWIVDSESVCFEAICGEAVCAGDDAAFQIIVHVASGGANAQLEQAISRVMHQHAEVVFQYDL